MTRHVVFGTGQVGRLVVEQLVARGVDVTAVNRSGGPPIAGADVVAGDASDVDFTTRATAGADAVYFCLNASAYDRWAIEFPPLQQGVLAGARAAGARLVVLDNLYAYGPTNGRDLVETLPARPTSTKAATRAAMTEDLLAAHRAGTSRWPSGGRRTTSARERGSRRWVRPSSPPPCLAVPRR